MGCLRFPSWIGITIGIVVVVILVAIIVVNRKWEAVKFFLFMRFNVLVNDDPPEEVDSLEFDAFVSFRYSVIQVWKQTNFLCYLCSSKINHLEYFPYSHLDSKFVKNEIQAHLEDKGYRLCIHERDFLVGASIPANIEVAINHSRRMIMIISR